MGTRGALGIRIDGVDKVAYNHFDSYPEGLGVDVVDSVKELLALGRDEMRALGRAVKIIDTDIPPTPEEQERFKPIANLGVSNKSLTDWYCLTRELQGSLKGYLKYGAIPGDGREFLRDSLFCEWAYIVNLDDFTLEVYKGFQRNQHTNGRYACEERRKNPHTGELDKYWPVALVGTFPLDDIPTTWIAQVDPPEDDA